MTSATGAVFAMYSASATTEAGLKRAAKKWMPLFRESRAFSRNLEELHEKPHPESRPSESQGHAEGEQERGRHGGPIELLEPASAERRGHFRRSGFNAVHLRNARVGFAARTSSPRETNVPSAGSLTSRKRRADRMLPKIVRPPPAGPRPSPGGSGYFKRTRDLRKTADAVIAHAADGLLLHALSEAAEAGGPAGRLRAIAQAVVGKRRSPEREKKKYDDEQPNADEDHHDRLRMLRRNIAAPLCYGSERRIADSVPAPGTRPPSWDREASVLQRWRRAISTTAHRTAIAKRQ
jgi:hypothetical protein